MQNILAWHGTVTSAIFRAKIPPLFLCTGRCTPGVFWKTSGCKASIIGFQTTWNKTTTTVNNQLCESQCKFSTQSLSHYIELKVANSFLHYYHFWYIDKACNHRFKDLYESEANYFSFKVRVCPFKRGEASVFVNRLWCLIKFVIDEVAKGRV